MKLVLTDDTNKIAKESEIGAENQPEKLPLDLAEIVAVWPELPEHIRQAI